MNIDSAISQPENKGQLFLAMLDGVALHYFSIYEQYPLTSMKTQLIQAAKDLGRDQIQGEKNDRN